MEANEAIVEVAEKLGLNTEVWRYNIDEGCFEKDEKSNTKKENDD